MFCELNFVIALCTARLKNKFIAVYVACYISKQLTCDLFHYRHQNFVFCFLVWAE